MRAEIDFQMRETTAQLYLSALVQPPEQAAAESLAGQGQRVRPYLDGLRSGARIEPGK